MSVMLKYRVVVGENWVSLPEGAKVLSFGWDEKITALVVWALVPHPEAEASKQTIHVIGTGWEFDNLWKRFIGTAILPSGLVFHCFVDLQ